MPNVNISISTRRPFGPLMTGRRGLTSLRDLINEIIGGQTQSDCVVYSRNDAVAFGSEAYPGQAVAALVFASSAGMVGCTLAGTVVTVTWATSDVLSMSAWCAAVRANASVNRYVTAANRVTSITLASVTAGQGLNICGVRFTAVGAAPTAFGEFDVSGSDTADATSLALAINRHPSLAGRVRAVSSTGVVYIGLTESRAATPDETVTPYATTITLNTAPNFPAHTVGLVLAMVPGAIGTEVRCSTATGTNVSLATNGTAGFLGNGTGGASAANIAVITP